MLLHRRFHRVILLIALLSCLSIPATDQPAQAMSSTTTPAVTPAQTITTVSDSIELVGSYGGALDGLAAHGNWLYAKHSGGLAVFDVSNPDQPVRRGHLLLPYAAKIANYADGILYLATVLDLYAIDVTNPDQPTIRATYKLSVSILSTPFDIQVVNDRLYLLYHQAADDNNSKDLLIFDVSDPDQLSPLGVYDDTLSPSIVELEVVGAFVYITRSSNGLTIVNASDPTNPTLHSHTTAFGRLFEIEREGNRLYIASSDNAFNEQLQIFDVSNPGNPVLIDTYSAPDFGIHAFKVQGNRAYVANSKFPNPHDLRILDVSDPENVTLLGSYPTDLNPLRQLLVAGNLVYLNSNDYEWENWVQVVDVSNPASPAGRGQILSPYSAEEIEVVGTTAYVAAGPDGLFIFDTSDPTQPHLRSTFGGAEGNDYNSVYEIQVVGNLAYVTANDSFNIVDVSNPDNPTLRAELPVRSFQLQVVGNRAYVISGDSFSIINISDPSNPTEIVTRNLTQYGQGFDIQVAGNRLYLAEGSCAEGCRGTVQILDMSNETNPVVIGTVNGPFGDIEIVGNLLYVQSEYYLYIYDISNIASPTLRYTGLTPTGPEELEIVGQYAYFVGGFWGGLQIADLSVPTLPKLRATFTTSIVGFSSRRSGGVEVVGDLVYVADAYNGLYIFRVDPAQFPSSIFAPIVGTSS